MAIKQVPQEINKQMILNLYSFFFFGRRERHQ